MIWMPTLAKKIEEPRSIEMIKLCPTYSFYLFSGPGCAMHSQSCGAILAQTSHWVHIPDDELQRRYWEHRIRDVDDFRRHVEYTHFNPVKHGHVINLTDWPWSTFHDHVKQGWVEPDWGTIEPDDIVSLDAGE
jgi:hypothetical protein